MNTTIKTLTIFTIASFVFMGGCLKKLTSFGFEYTTKSSMSTGNLAAGTHIYGETKYTSTIDSVIKANGGSIDMLDELKLKSANVTLQLPAGDNFDKCDNIELYIQADGNPEVLIASKNPVMKGLNSVDLDVNNSTNLMNYLKSATVTFRVKGTNNAPLSPMTLGITAVWDAKASK